MAGDRLWGEQTWVEVDFLGHKVRLPDTPHLFALMSGAPLMTFFVHEKAPGRYHVQVSKGRKVAAATRADRKKAVQESVQAYADDLARFAAAHPLNGIILSRFSVKKSFGKRRSPSGRICFAPGAN